MSERRTFASPLLWSLIGVVICLFVIGGFVVKVLLVEDDFSATKKMATVTLIKPPPSTPVKKPQEPEPPKEKHPPRETLDDKPGATRAESYTDVVSHPSNAPPSPVDQAPAPAHTAMESAPPPVTGPVNVSPADAQGGGDGGGAPTGGALGLDAEGKGGGDAFGLVARRGGRSITAGGGSGRGGVGTPTEAGPMVAHKAPVSKPAPKVVKIGGNPMGKADREGGGTEVPLLEKYGWYTEKVKVEVTAHIRKQIEENRQTPRGKFQTVIRISVDHLGAVIDTQIIGSSGNQEMDEMVKRSIANLTITEPPPEGMPKTLVIRVTSQSG